MEFSKGAAGPLVFKGYTASALLFDDRVEFQRRWVAKLGGNRPGAVLLDDVLKVHYREPSRLVNGHVHLLTAEDPGGLRVWADAPVKQVAGNPRAILFTWNQRDVYAKFLATVEAAWRQRRPRI